LSSPSSFAICAKNVRGIERAVLSVHCHDDLGMAVANSLTAVVAGRARSSARSTASASAPATAPLEEVVMALKNTRHFLQRHESRTDDKLYPTSRLVSNITGQPNPAQQGGRR